jgi:hypothetical protein
MPFSIEHCIDDLTSFAYKTLHRLSVEAPMRPAHSSSLMLPIVVATGLKWLFLALYLLVFLIWYPFARVKLKLHSGSSGDSTVVSPWDETATPTVQSVPRAPTRPLAS